MSNWTTLRIGLGCVQGIVEATVGRNYRCVHLVMVTPILTLVWLTKFSLITKRWISTVSRVLFSTTISYTLSHCCYSNWQRKPILLLVAYIQNNCFNLLLYHKSWLLSFNFKLFNFPTTLHCAHIQSCWKFIAVSQLWDLSALRLLEDMCHTKCFITLPLFLR